LIAAPGSPRVIDAVCALRFRTPIPWLGDHLSPMNCSTQVRGDVSITMLSPVHITPAVRTFRTDANLMRGDHMLRNCSAKRVGHQIRLNGSCKSIVRELHELWNRLVKFSRRQIHIDGFWMFLSLSFVLLGPGRFQVPYSTLSQDTRLT
jgi:hypothetical protein